MTAPALLRAQAAALAAPLPPLLADAERLAQTVILGDHGRRRPGIGDAFWQYRPAMPGDPARSIDWRRSARSDAAYVQEKEWELAQSVVLWVDLAASMTFASRQNLPTKVARARLLALAAAILLLRGGERVGLHGGAAPARGQPQAEALARHLARDDIADYGTPPDLPVPPHGRAILVSDFLGDLAPLEVLLEKALARGVRGALLQVLDPAEEDFPFQGRTVFESMGATLRHETLKAGDLAARYRTRMADRKARLQALARAANWQFTTHHTHAAAAPALLWLSRAVERR